MCKEVSNSASNCVIIEGRKYSVRSVPVRNSATNLNQAIPPMCNGYLIENYGTAIAFINDKPLLPQIAPGLSGESFSVSGNPGDYFTGEIVISFDTVGVGLLWISYQIYI